MQSSHSGQCPEGKHAKTRHLRYNKVLTQCGHLAMHVYISTKMMEAVSLKRHVQGTSASVFKIKSNVFLDNFIQKSFFLDHENK